MKAFDREQQIYDFIQLYWTQHGYAPGISEIAEDVSLSRSAVYRHLLHLQLRGAVNWTPNYPRTIHIAGPLD